MKIIVSNPSLMILKEDQRIFQILCFIFFMIFSLLLFDRTFQQDIVLFTVVTFLLAAALYLLLNSKTSLLRMDKERTTLSCIQKSLLSYSFRDYPLSTIHKIRLKRYSINPSSPVSNPIFVDRLFFVFFDGKELPFSPNKYRAASFFIKIYPVKEMRLGKSVADFLGVEFEDMDMQKDLHPLSAPVSE